MISKRDIEEVRGEVIHETFKAINQLNNLEHRTAIFESVTRATKTILKSIYTNSDFERDLTLRGDQL